MSSSKRPSPARSQGSLVTPRLSKPKRTQSVGSPARSTASGRLSALVQFKENKGPFVLSPAPSRRSVLNDDTDIEEPRRKSWWKNLGENSCDMMEVLNDNKILETNEAAEEYIEIEVLSQEKKDYTIDLPESSDSESISSIVIPQRKLFTHKDSQAQNKFGQLIGKRETLAKLHMTNVADKTVNVAPKTLFGKNNKVRVKPVFPAGLLNISPDRTANKTKEAAAEVKVQVKSLFGNRAETKRKNMFTDFILSESEEEISDIQPKVFGFPKKAKQRRDSPASRGKREHSPTSSITTDIEIDEWQHLPSSTMVDNQFDDTLTEITPAKRARLSQLAETKVSQPEIIAEHKKESEEEQVELKYDDENELNSEKDVEIAQNRASKQYFNENVENNVHNVSKNKELNQNRMGIECEIVQLAQEVNKSKTEIQNISKITIENIKTSEFDDVKHKSRNHSKNGIQDEVDNNPESQKSSQIISDTRCQTLNKSKSRNVSLKNRTNEIIEQETSSAKENENILEDENEIEAEVEEESEGEVEEDDDEAVEQSNVEDQDNKDEEQIENENEAESNDEAQNESQDKVQNESEIEVQNESEVEAQDESEDEAQNESEVEDQNESQVEVQNESEDEVQNESEMEVQNESEVEAQDESEDEAQNESEVEDQNESQVEVQKVSEDEVQNESEMEVQNESEVEAQDESEDEAQNESEVEDQNESQVEVQNVSEDEVQNESEMEVQNESEVEAQYESEDEAQNESEVEDQNESEDEEQNESEELQFDNETEEEVQIESNVDAQDASEDEIQDSNDLKVIQHSKNAEDSPNETHDTTGRYRKKNESILDSPEEILHEKTNQISYFAAQGRNTSIRKTTMLKNMNISVAPLSESTGTTNSSAEASGWDSHRTTRKTMRQTFGKDFTPRKSLRALVMEKSAKRQTAVTDLTSVTCKFPQANSTELPEGSIAVDEENVPDTVHDVSKCTRQTTLEMYLQMIKKENLEMKTKAEEAVKKSLQMPTRDYNPFKLPAKPLSSLRKQTSQKQAKPKAKTAKSTLINRDDLPPEMIKDMNYKPPKRFRPSNASWLTKRLYNFLESKLKSKYDYKSRVRAERLASCIYEFTREVRRRELAPQDAVDALKREMARLDVVKTHFDFYQFFHDFMPREIRIKVVPDIVNKIDLPRDGVFSDILRENNVQGPSCSRNRE